MFNSTKFTEITVDEDELYLIEIYRKCNRSRKFEIMTLAENSVVAQECEDEKYKNVIDFSLFREYRK